MDTTVHMSDETLRRLIRDIDARPVPARLRHKEAELLAQRLRRIPPANLRQRIAVA
jgi:hypothetical protein